MLKEIVRIANLLDKKGLRKEASILDSLLEKIAQYDDMYDDMDDELNEDVKLAINSFIEKHLNPTSSVDPATGVPVSDMLYNRNEELNEYVLEHLPDVIYDLSANIGMSPDKLYAKIIDKAESLDKYNKNEDFEYLIDAVKFHLDEVYNRNFYQL